MSELVPSVPGWWKVCFVYGDQTKYYRKLYGKKSAQVRNLKSYAVSVSGSATSEDPSM